MDERAEERTEEEEDNFCQACKRKVPCNKCADMRGNACGGCGISMEDPCYKCQPKRYSSMMVQRTARRSLIITSLIVFFVVMSTTLSCLGVILLGMLWKTGMRPYSLSMIVFVALPCLICFLTMICSLVVTESSWMCVPGSLTDEEAINVVIAARGHALRHVPFIRLYYCKKTH